MSIPVVDLVVIVAYLVGVTAVGLLSVRRLKLTGEVVAASLLTPAPPREQVEAVTWASPWQVIAHGRIEGIGDPRVLAGLLLLLMAVLYTVFR
jgi:hypothetical protein